MAFVKGSTDKVLVRENHQQYQCQIFCHRSLPLSNFGHEFLVAKSVTNIKKLNELICHGSFASFKRTFATIFYHRMTTSNIYHRFPMKKSISNAIKFFKMNLFNVGNGNILIYIYILIKNHFATIFGHG